MDVKAWLKSITLYIATTTTLLFVCLLFVLLLIESSCNPHFGCVERAVMRCYVSSSCKQSSGGDLTSQFAYCQSQKWSLDLVARQIGGYSVVPLFIAPFQFSFVGRSRWRKQTTYWYGGGGNRCGAQRWKKNRLLCARAAVQWRCRDRVMKSPAL